MTKFARLLCAILLIVSAFLMFVPIATFEDNSAAALQEEIDKQVGRLESEQAKLQRYVDQGKKQADIDKLEIHNEHGSYKFVRNENYVLGEYQKHIVVDKNNNVVGECALNNWSNAT